MRRFLLSIVLALVVGGTVLGAAATLPITTAPLSAGEVIVSSCDSDGTNISWSTWWNPSGRFEVVGMYLHNVDAACYGRYTEVVLTGGGATLAITSDVSWEWLTSDTAYFFAEFLAFEIPVAAVEDVHVQIH